MPRFGYRSDKDLFDHRGANLFLQYIVAMYSNKQNKHYLHCSYEDPDVNMSITRGKVSEESPIVPSLHAHWPVQDYPGSAHFGEGLACFGTDGRVRAVEVPQMIPLLSGHSISASAQYPRTNPCPIAQS